MENGVLLAPGTPMAQGREAVEKLWKSTIMELKNFHLEFAPTKIEVASSGDLAYEMGTYSLAEPPGPSCGTAGPTMGEMGERTPHFSTYIPLSCSCRRKGLRCHRLDHRTVPSRRLAQRPQSPLFQITAGPFWP
jgi:hypothetical protein